MKTNEMHCRHGMRDMESRLAALLHRHGGGRGKGLLSFTVALPDLAFDALPPGLAAHHYWANPADGVFLLGLGRAASVETRGEGRLRALDAAYTEYRRLWEAVDADGCALQPVVLAGFAFDQERRGNAWPNASLTVPRLLLQRHGGTCAATFTYDRESAPENTLSAWRADWQQLTRSASLPRGGNPLTRIAVHPGDDIWIERASQAVADIRARHLDKLVLSRRITVRGQTTFEPATVMAALARRYPGCFRFSHCAGGATFLGATPERLVSLRREQARSTALAGTAWDAPSLEQLNDDKNLQEHRLVVNAIVHALEPACRFLEIPARPEILALHDLHHLKSEIRATVKPGVTLLNLVERLHPTPAVGGWPAQAAHAWLLRHGEQRPAWYSGASGWLGLNGDGDFAVALRCALLEGHEAELYAGAGIVAASDPRAELAETEAKLGAMLTALTGR